MARFIDLDEIAPDPVRVRFAGIDYQLPGDLPIPDYIALDELSRRALTTEDGDEITEIFDDIAERLLELFRIHQPDIEELPIGPRTLLPLVLEYLNGTDATQADPEADAVPPRRGGTTTKRSTAPRAKTTTRTTRRKASV